MAQPALSEAFSTRLQKGGALIADMRSIVTAWTEGLEKGDPVSVISRTLPKATPARLKDTYIRAFKPRFLNGSPPQAWKVLRVLEEASADFQVLRAFYYWITARAELPLYGFVDEVVLPMHRSGRFDIRVEDAVAWLGRKTKEAGLAWTPTVTLKVSRGILAALRDFAILEGENRKRIAPAHLGTEAFALLAFCLHGLGESGSALVRHPDWRLFLLGETGVEHLFLESHQHGWLRFESAGNIVRVEFPEITFEEYVHVVLG